jgi:hypothetical protein
MGSSPSARDFMHGNRGCPAMFCAVSRNENPSLGGIKRRANNRSEKRKMEFVIPGR